MAAPRHRPEVSVVVPVFDAGVFLEPCIRSILDGRSVVIEVLCVDDGSTDGSLDLLRRWSRDDSRLQIFSGQLRGQGHARNLALNRASGDYIAFVDADDWLEVGALEIAFDEISRRKLDMLCFESLRHDERNNTVEPHPYTEHHRALPPGFDSSCFTWMDLRQHPASLWRLPVVPWGTLFRRGLLEDHRIRFPEGIKFEDNPFFWRAMLRASAVGTMSQRLYHHRVHRNSTTGRIAEHLESIPRMHHMFLVELLEEHREPELLGSYVHAVYDAWLWRFLSFPVHTRAKFIPLLHHAVSAFPRKLESIWKPLPSYLHEFIGMVRRHPGLVSLRRELEWVEMLETCFAPFRALRRETHWLRKALSEVPDSLSRY